jgi:hypothetical protein
MIKIVPTKYIWVGKKEHEIPKKVMLRYWSLIKFGKEQAYEYVKEWGDKQDED